jgi:hypothetical protein
MSYALEVILRSIDPASPPEVVTLIQGEKLVSEMVIATALNLLRKGCRAVHVIVQEPIAPEGDEFYDQVVVKTGDALIVLQDVQTGEVLWCKRLGRRGYSIERKLPLQSLPLPPSR